MSTEPIPESEGKPRRLWWREWEVLLLVALVAVAYFVRIGDVSMRGEEPTRARVGFDVLDRGDWIVPWNEYEPFLSRPPLQNWLIAASTVMCGSRDPWVVRLPSVLAMLGTVLLIYGYSRTRLSRVGALAAAAAFATFGEMFATGCQAETEMIFIALISASLILWHWGQVQSWRDVWTWIGSYTFVALAVLCKGPQPPVYFLGSVGAYLLLTAQWRRLFSRAHFAGIGVGVIIVLAWLVPFIWKTNLAAAWCIVMGDTAMRMHTWQVQDVLLHLVQFPVEILCCTFPWSLLLLAFALRDVRRCLGESRPLVFFAAVCVGLAFPTCWLPPGGQTRYFSPLYSCMAVLIGAVVDRCASAGLPMGLRNAWRRYSVLLAGAMGLAALAAVSVSQLLIGHERYGVFAEPRWIALGYAAIVIVLAVLVLRGRQAGDVTQVRRSVLAVTAFMVLTVAGLLTNVRVRMSEDQASAVARLKESLPEGTRLISLGRIDHLFAYYYADAIDFKPAKASTVALMHEPEACFCFDSVDGWRPKLPFPWEEVAVVSMDRHRHDVPERAVVVGRRCYLTSTSVVYTAMKPTGN